MARVILGILAHVDAGKTTLSEGLLYLSGAIRRLGRVDHRDAFLDTDALERARGITIFSKQAQFALPSLEATLLDTPGHVDFSAETERVLQVLDYALLVVSGADGVQGHTLTLWRLLKRYRIPVFLFVNKMDQPGTDRDALLQELATRLDHRCVDFGVPFGENLAMCDEAMLEAYLKAGRLETPDIADWIRERKVFPCYFGSALKLEGVAEFLTGLGQYCIPPAYPQEFGARVFKITRDKQGNRLTHMKITGGSLRTREVLENHPEEKVGQIREYSGEKYQLLPEAEAGRICAVTGFTETYAGESLGQETGSYTPVLEPVLNYRLFLPPGCDPQTAFGKLRKLEEEEPQLHILWEETTGEIHAQVMGEVEMEVLASILQERFELSVTFGPGSLIYKETILEPAEGVGHFEPLRHYAEVHLLLQPGEPGSGLRLDCRCDTDMLAKSYQRLILSHLQEEPSKGVLTGAQLTDMRITLVAGRAHPKHTQGGDFRQATGRALRQGLKKAGSILLEPVYEFRLELPQELAGRALADIRRMRGQAAPPLIQGELAVVTGSAPVATMRDYQREVAAYSRGYGKLSCVSKGYEPCHNAEEVIARKGYDADGDPEHPCGSVFCAHGAGFSVPWDRVEEYMHVEACRMDVREEAWAYGAKDGGEPEKPGEAGKLGGISKSGGAGKRDEDWKPGGSGKPSGIGQSGNPSARRKESAACREERELEEIFTRTYGAVKRERSPFKRTVKAAGQDMPGKPATPDKPAVPSELTMPSKLGMAKYLLVDGYNMIFAWEELNELAQASLDAARYQLMDVLCNYCWFRGYKVIVVFDAYKVAGHPGSVTDYHGLSVVYTKEAETADQYIEKVVHEIGKKYEVTVATSDAMEQMIIWGDGASRLSASGLKEEIRLAEVQLRTEYLEKAGGERHYPFREIRTENQET
ncbi:MAG: TetM/TetW/TetO/TetS family tetracycline resistance ribosomal protection protein [Clostridium sp.]|jgi:small GTP-binding protein|nr:TetM/TetW/TetO/TetS family tetracycline resistance ribosomal protection protein [Clostridium sp.]